MADAYQAMGQPQPVQNQIPAQQQMFDPYTGKPITPQFDVYTGQPIDPAAQPTQTL